MLLRLGELLWPKLLLEERLPELMLLRLGELL